MIDQIANELIIASLLLHTNKISTIAEKIGYKPMLITSALYRGEETGKFVWDRKHDIIKISPDVAIEALGVTEAIDELTEQIEIFMGYLNAIEKDQSVEELQIWLAGMPELQIKLAVFASKKLTTYELADPKDKLSVYTFITMKENIDKRWGVKQLDPKTSKINQRLKK